jgi:hypothetical protein
MTHHYHCGCIEGLVEVLWGGMGCACEWCVCVVCVCVVSECVWGRIRNRSVCVCVALCCIGFCYVRWVSFDCSVV